MKFEEFLKFFELWEWWETQAGIPEILGILGLWLISFSRRIRSRAVDDIAAAVVVVAVRGDGHHHMLSASCSSLSPSRLPWTYLWLAIRHNV